MKTKTLVIATVIIAATAALAIAPLASTVWAERGGRNTQGDTTVEQCTHNGNGETTSSSDCGPGNSEQDTSYDLFKCRGKYYTDLADSPCA